MTDFSFKLVAEFLQLERNFLSQFFQFDNNKIVRNVFCEIPKLQSQLNWT